MSASPLYPANPTPEQLIAAMRQLPPSARVLSKLQMMLADTDSSLEDVANLIRLDASLTTRVIQISNSVWFGRGNICRTIEDAVNRVGFREVYRFVAVMAAGAMVAGPLSAYGRTSDIIWDESVAAGLAAELIANSLGEDSAVAYAVGLLHLIGRQPICLYLEQTGIKHRLVYEGFPADNSASEFSLLGYTQAEVGAQMLEKWDFSNVIVEPIRKQYDPLEAEEPHDRMASILYCSRILRTAFLTDSRLPEVDGEAAILAHLHLDRNDLYNLRTSLEEQVIRVHQITKG